MKKQHLKVNLWIVLSFSAILYLIFLLHGDVALYNDLSHEEKVLLKLVEQEEGQALALKAKLKKLSKNGYIEEIARERLGLIMKGERLYKICP